MLGWAPQAPGAQSARTDKEDEVEGEGKELRVSECKMEEGNQEVEVENAGDSSNGLGQGPREKTFHTVLGEERSKTASPRALKGEAEPEEREELPDAPTAPQVDEASDAADQLRVLREELEIAKQEAKLAAEIGQKLLNTSNEKSETISKLKEMIKERDENTTKMQEYMQNFKLGMEQDAETFEETKAELERLKIRNTTLSQKLEVSNREALRASAAVTELENTLEEARMERDSTARRLADLNNQLAQLKAIALLSEQPRSRQDSASSWISTERNETREHHNTPLKTPVKPLVSTDSKDTNESNAEADANELLETPPPTLRLRNELESVRAERENDQARIRELEKTLQKTVAEQLQSTKKMRYLEDHLDEYEELIAAQSSLTCSYKDRLEGEAHNDDVSTLETALLREEVEKLRRERDQGMEKQTREFDAETTIDDIPDLEDIPHPDVDISFRSEQFEQLMQLNQSMQSQKLDACVTTEEAEPALETSMQNASTQDALTSMTVDANYVPNFHSNENQARYIDPKSPVDRDGHSGPLLVKLSARSLLFGAKKWKPRVVELRGPRLLFFRNEWDVKPCKIVPIDGCEVRCVRRPHRSPVVGNTFDDKDFDLDLASIKRRGGRLEGRKASFSTVFFGPTHEGYVQASLQRSARVLHEFHLWHPRRPVVYFSAPNHQELSSWAEQIQKVSTKGTNKPRRFAAGYITLVENGASHLARFFAVLRTDGIHLYRHPRRRTCERVVLLDTNARIWKPETCRKASKLLDDIGRTVCIQNSEQGLHTFMADTDVDCDWWVSTLRAHCMGVVSWGGVTGMRDDEPFGCLNI